MRCIVCKTQFCCFQERSFCYSDCSFTYAENNRTITFDLSDLSNVSSLVVGPSFTSKGTKYLHMFNVSLCGNKVMCAFMGQKKRTFRSEFQKPSEKDALLVFGIAGEGSSDLLG